MLLPQLELNRLHAAVAWVFLAAVTANSKAKLSMFAKPRKKKKRKKTKKTKEYRIKKETEKKCKEI